MTNWHVAVINFFWWLLNTIFFHICFLSDASPPVNTSPIMNSFEMDLFGSDPIGALALVSVPQPTDVPSVEPSASSGFETDSFMGMPPASTGFSEV